MIVWDVGSGARREELSGHADSVMTAAFSPDGETLYTASLDGTAIAWDLSGDRRLGRALAGEATSNAGRFSPDGKLIAVGLQNGGIGLWDASSLEPRGVLDTAGPESVESVEFSPDAETLGALHGPGSATLWDVETRSLLHRWAELWETWGNRTSSPAFQPRRDDGRRRGPDEPGDALGIPQPVTAWARSTDPQAASRSTPAASSSQSHCRRHSWRSATPCYWTSRAARSWRTSATGAGGMYTVAFSPDGQTLATSGWDQVVRLWNVATREVIRELPQRDFERRGAAPVQPGWTHARNFRKRGQRDPVGRCERRADREARWPDGGLGAHPVEADLGGLRSVDDGRFLP